MAPAFDPGQGWGGQTSNNEMRPEAGGCLLSVVLLTVLLSGGKRRDLEIEEVLFHPNYDINGKKAEGVPEFYDYDVALIKLKTKLKYDQTLR